jgi:hypothetical protein
LLDLDYGNDPWIAPNTEADRLFFTSKWPSALAKAYEKAVEEEDKQAAANVAVERINRFIATNGAE